MEFQLPNYRKKENPKSILKIEVKELSSETINR